MWILRFAQISKQAYERALKTLEEARCFALVNSLVGLADMCFSAQSMCWQVAFVGHYLLAADFDGGLFTSRKFDEFSFAE
jgi:hypothetical protein